MAKAKKGQRTKSGRLSRAKLALQERNPPAQHILDRRELFSFVTPTKGPDGRVGEIDQDICDGIGQLHALGLLDGHGIDAQELRDKGRRYAELWWSRYSATAPKVGKFERSDRSTSTYDGPTKDDREFARMDEALEGYERQCVMDLCIDTQWDDAITPWALGLIHEALLERKRVVSFMRFPTMDDRARLEAAIRGLAAIVDGALPQRWERAA